MTRLLNLLSVYQNAARQYQRLRLLSRLYQSSFNEQLIEPQLHAER